MISTCSSLQPSGTLTSFFIPLHEPGCGKVNETYLPLGLRLCLCSNLLGKSPSQRPSCNPCLLALSFVSYVGIVFFFFSKAESYYVYYVDKAGLKPRELLLASASRVLDKGLCPCNWLSPLLPHLVCYPADAACWNPD